MSRCFPYPPPGYTVGSAREEALIDSIKLQKERVKSDDQGKKEKRRDKKEKRKDEKRKDKKSKSHSKHEKLGTVTGHIGEKESLAADIKKDPYKGSKAEAEQLERSSDIGEKELLAADIKKDPYKGSKAEAEQLERSSVTEELGDPLRLPCVSSDSTENSNKRKRLSAEPVDSIRGHGKIIRIRLTKKPSQTDASANEQQVCSTSGRTDLPSQNIDDINLRQIKSKGISSTDKALLPLVISKGQVCSSSTLQNIDDINLRQIKSKGISSTDQALLPLVISKGQVCSSSKQIKMPAISVKDSVMSPMQRIALEYNNLTVNCSLPPLEIASSNADDDLDWLFQGKNQNKGSEKRRVCRKEGLSCSSSLMSWPPRAQHLPEVDLYALPYTIPL